MNTHKLILSLGLAMSATAGVPTTADDAISRLHWFTGHWCLDAGGRRVEEQWLPPSGGLLIGMGRTITAGKASAFEFMRIEVIDGVPTLMAQPGGEPAVPFRLTASGKDWARFENPEYDFPKRVEYRRSAQGLYAEIGAPAEGGREKKKSFDYRYCSD